MQANPDYTYIIQEWNQEISKDVTFSGARTRISTTREGDFHQQTLVLLQSNFEPRNHNFNFFQWIEYWTRIARGFQSKKRPPSNSGE